MSKIDRVHGNVQWEEAFPNAIVSFLPGGAYDHSPMLIQFTKQYMGINRLDFSMYGLKGMIFWKSSSMFGILLFKDVVAFKYLKN